MSFLNKQELESMFYLNIVVAFLMVIWLTFCASSKDNG